MFKKFSLILIICLFYNQIAFSAASGGSEKDDGGNEGKISKFKEGHKLVLSGKYLEKKADKFKKKGKIDKAEKSLAKAKKSMRGPSKNCWSQARKNQMSLIR